MEQMYPCWTVDLRNPEDPFTEAGLWCRQGDNPTLPCACRALPLRLWGNYLKSVLDQHRRWGDYFLEYAERMGFLYASYLRTTQNHLLTFPFGQSADIYADTAIVALHYQGVLKVPPEAEGQVVVLKDMQDPCDGSFRSALCIMRASARSHPAYGLMVILAASQERIFEEVLVTYRGGGRNFNPQLFRLSAKDGQPPSYFPFIFQPKRSGVAGESAVG